MPTKYKNIVKYRRKIIKNRKRYLLRSGDTTNKTTVSTK